MASMEQQLQLYPVEIRQFKPFQHSLENISQMILKFFILNNLRQSLNIFNLIRKKQLKEENLPKTRVELLDMNDKYKQPDNGELSFLCQ